ncbi:MAG: nitroreductase family protein [Candidatus Omnitrophica bacterium]|jgi:nitroreductase|nr:nitroreductase family protein [Candidatus Omnitrophota bacterium]
MDILKLIKTRRTIRRYKNKPIPQKILDKIIEAGIWGPSVPSFLRIQPWRFIVITKKTTIKKISEIALARSKKLGAGANILLSAGSRIIACAPAVILIYNSGDLAKLKNKYKAAYNNFGEIIPRAELSAISAAIQNMILAAEALGIGSCWLDTPLFSKNEINKLLGVKDDLIAVLTLGYADEEGRRSPRKPLTEAIKYIK